MPRRPSHKALAIAFLERCEQLWTREWLEAEVHRRESVVSAGEGNKEAAREARRAARLVLDNWQRAGAVEGGTAA